MSDLLRVTVEGGKYEVVQLATGAVEVLRGGTLWLHTPSSELTGFPSKLILCMAQEIRHLRALLVTCPDLDCVGDCAGSVPCNGGSICPERVALGEATWKDLANQ